MGGRSREGSRWEEEKKRALPSQKEPKTSSSESVSHFIPFLPRRPGCIQWVCHPQYKYRFMSWIVFAKRGQYAGCITTCQNRIKSTHESLKILWALTHTVHGESYENASIPFDVMWLELSFGGVVLNDENLLSPSPKGGLLPKSK